MAHENTLVPSDWVAITKSDTVSVHLVGFYVGTAGDVAVLTSRGTTTIFPSVPSGAIIPGLFSKILSTGTTASGIVGAKP